ncbi:phosphotransferase enzyme family protein [Longispora albida]|uniref:phosphotransferase enzyme family protein n=1 Tax=Longispora albida TaxID=203523 RepID=UPI00037DFF58|nr:aminoglycoside phosphotransferase family protein [Longispora albida]
MMDKPQGISDSDVRQALTAGWGITNPSMVYLPVGAGGYHWSATGDDGRAWFVTVSDLSRSSLGQLRAAFGTAHALRHDAGLGFVVAPVLAADGTTAVPLGDRYALSVFPLVPGTAGRFGRHAPADREPVLRLLAELHEATPHAPAGVPRADLVLPGRAGLEDALASAGTPWTGGVYSEDARALLAGSAEKVRDWLGTFDRLVAEVRAGSAGWVVTHGEPHPGNLIRGTDGFHLIDWDTVQLAPRERDLWMVDGDHAAYTAITGHEPGPSALALYRQWWDLADIAIYATELRAPHTDTEDTRATLTYLTRYLS